MERRSVLAVKLKMLLHEPFTFLVIDLCLRNRAIICPSNILPHLLLDHH